MLTAGIQLVGVLVTMQCCANGPHALVGTWRELPTASEKRDPNYGSDQYHFGADGRGSRQLTFPLIHGERHAWSTVDNFKWTFQDDVLKFAWTSTKSYGVSPHDAAGDLEMWNQVFMNHVEDDPAFLLSHDLLKIVFVVPKGYEIHTYKRAK